MANEQWLALDKNDEQKTCITAKSMNNGSKEKFEV